MLTKHHPLILQPFRPHGYNQRKYMKRRPKHDRMSEGGNTEWDMNSCVDVKWKTFAMYIVPLNRLQKSGPLWGVIKEHIRNFSCMCSKIINISKVHIHNHDLNLVPLAAFYVFSAPVLDSKKTAKVFRFRTNIYIYICIYIYDCLCSRDITVYYQTYAVPFSANMLIWQDRNTSVRNVSYTWRCDCC